MLQHGFTIHSWVWVAGFGSILRFWCAVFSLSFLSLFLSSLLKALAFFDSDDACGVCDGEDSSSCPWWERGNALSLPVFLIPALGWIWIIFKIQLSHIAERADGSEFCTWLGSLSLKQSQWGLVVLKGRRARGLAVGPGCSVSLLPAVRVALLEGARGRGSGP